MTRAYLTAGWRDRDCWCEHMYLNSPTFQEYFPQPRCDRQGIMIWLWPDCDRTVTGPWLDRDRTVIVPLVRIELNLFSSLFPEAADRETRGGAAYQEVSAFPIRRALPRGVLHGKKFRLRGIQLQVSGLVVVESARK